MATKDKGKVDLNGGTTSPLDGGMATSKPDSATASQTAQQIKQEAASPYIPAQPSINGENPNWLNPQSVWPPPIFFNSATASAQERYYIEHRWHAQWSYYDGKASDAKKAHQRLQLVIAIGSVIVPVLVGLNIDGAVGDLLRYLTVIISIIVAAAAAIETVKQYGDNWRNFRSAAEELKREKSMYDVLAGPYRKSKDPFLLFVERSEDIMAKQNGAWIALKEEAAAAKERADDDDNNPAAGISSPVATDTMSTTTVTPTNSTGSDLG